MKNSHKQFKQKDRHELVNDDKQPSLLDHAPSDVIPLIGSFLPDNESKANFSRTCQTTYHFFQPDIIKLMTKKLLQHAMNGEPVEIDKMLSRDPNLLKLRGTVANKAGSKLINRTVFQVALATSDTNMWQLTIEPYFDRIENGADEKAKQVHEQFPTLDDESTRKKFDFNALIHVIAADTVINMQGNQMSDETCDALKVFKEYFTPHEVTTGYQFDLRYLLDALKAYRLNYGLFNNWPQRTLYCIKVIGWLESLINVCDAQVFCQGLYGVVSNLVLLERCLLINKDEGADFYAEGLGDTHFIFVNPMMFRATAEPIATAAPPVSISLLEHYLNNKQALLADLKERVATQPDHHKKLCFCSVQ